MELTVCICTHNRARYVHDCLDGLTRQTLGPDRFAVLLVDSGSTGDAPAELAKLAGHIPNVQLIRVDHPGVSAARNAGAWACRTPYIAYIDDDAIPAAGWVECILAAIAADPRPPAVLAGRILPKWEAPLPPWWPRSLRGVLSIIETEGQGEFRRPGLPANLAPYAANMVLHVPCLRAIGGFPATAGRYGTALLSDEEVQVAWRLQEAGHPVRYDSRLVVHHQIQAGRLTPEWLLSRLYWQGASTVLTHRQLQRPGRVWRELPRRLAVTLLCAPAGLLPRHATWLIGPRWRLAYSLGFIRAALGWHADAAARRASAEPAAGAIAPV
jgi:GT2 family glycosyltransferase